MLATARSKAPELSWVHGDLANLAVGRSFDAVVLAGNVMIFVDPGTEGEIVRRIAEHLTPGGLLIAGFQLRVDRIGLDAEILKGVPRPGSAHASLDFVED